MLNQEKVCSDRELLQITAQNNTISKHAYRNKSND